MGATAGPEPSTRTDGAAILPASALSLRSLTAGYGATTAVRGVDIEVGAGRVVAVLGPNGAGKTTTLRVAAGLLAARGGTVTVQGADVTHRPPHQRLRAGLCLIPEGRGIFRALTVAENLRLYRPPWAADDGMMDRTLELFPLLGERLGQTAGSMSGGQQQMLALARATLSGASVVLLDEVSMGLSPIMVDNVFAAMRALAAQGLALLVVEQYVARALDLADEVVVLRKGEVAFTGPPAALDDETLARHYLGADAPTPA